MAVLTGGIWFLVVVLISISPAPIRNAEYLVLWWLEYFFFHECVEILFQLESCKVGVCAIYFSGTYPRIFLEASCHWQHTCPLANWRCLWSSCSYRKCPHGGSTWGRQHRESWLPGLWNRVECTRGTFQGLCLLIPLKASHTHTAASRLIPTGATAPCWLCFRA